jgi:Protein of unknown function (DUF3667)
LPVSLFLIKKPVSHSKIRTEKTCLNCGAEITGRYCSACGQENIEPKQTVWHLIQHFFSDVTHFDGKFFETVKDLFAKPGFLSKEYMIGRRISYLDPIRMYIFTSAIFFLIFFALYDVTKLHVGAETKTEIQKDPELRELISKAKNATDSLRILNNYNSTATPLIKLDEDSSPNKKRGVQVKVAAGEYQSVEAYDSAQKTLPENKRNGWVRNKLTRRQIEISRQFDENPGGSLKEWLGNFMHSFPKVLFISLPLFALILNLLYVRHKNFYYVDHGIFSVHLYIFSFLLLLVIFGLNQLHHATRWALFGWLEFALIVYAFVYYFKAMRRFYGQSKGKTFLKYALLFLMASIVQLTIFVVAFLYSVVES